MKFHQELARWKRLAAKACLTYTLIHREDKTFMILEINPRIELGCGRIKTVADKIPTIKYARIILKALRNQK